MVGSRTFVLKLSEEKEEKMSDTTEAKFKVGDKVRIKSSGTEGVIDGWHKSGKSWQIATKRSNDFGDSYTYYLYRSDTDLELIEDTTPAAPKLRYQVNCTIYNTFTVYDNETERDICECKTIEDTRSILNAMNAEAEHNDLRRKLEAHTTYEMVLRRRANDVIQLSDSSWWAGNSEWAQAASALELCLKDHVIIAVAKKEQG